MTIIIDGTVGANKAVVLDSSGKLPAIDGSLVTTLNATQVTTGSIATARIDTGTTTGKVLVLDGSGNMPAIAAGSMTGVSSATKSASDPATDTNASLGTKWINTTSGEIFVLTDATTDANIWRGQRDTNIGNWGIFCGGQTAGAGTQINTIDYITIASTGDGADFGDLVAATSNAYGTSDSHGGL